MSSTPKEFQKELMLILIDLKCTDPLRIEITVSDATQAITDLVDRLVIGADRQYEAHDTLIDSDLEAYVIDRFRAEQRKSLNNIKSKPHDDWYAGKEW